MDFGFGCSFLGALVSTGVPSGFLMIKPFLTFSTRPFLFPGGIGSLLSKILYLDSYNPRFEQMFSNEK